MFVEEVTRLLLERGEQGGLQAIPPTLQQSLAARLDRLGDAREVAQIGAVLGRDFSYALLHAVSGVDDPDLQSALDRLTSADLFIAEGAPPQASYRFKHALIQDAAYDSLLKSRRQALHRRAAEILRDDPERAAAEPEVIAHHFTQGGLDDLAIEWWGKAGDQAPSPLRLPGGDRPSRQGDRHGGQGGGWDCGGRVGRAGAIARGLRQCADPRERLWSAGDDRSVRKGARNRSWR
jgi:predicted ATPase